MKYTPKKLETEEEAMTYLVTGVTGGYGGYALTYLKELVPISEIAILVRSEEKGEAFKAQGYDVRVSDYENPETLVAAFEGVDRLLFVSAGTDNRRAQHKNVVEAASKAGVSYIAYTSFADVEHSNHALAPDHLYTEKLITEAGIAHTFLRNNWYFENELPLINSSLSSGQFVYAAKDGKIGWALKREYAEVGAEALAGADFGEVLELSGTLRTYGELVTALESATGKNIAAFQGTDDEFITSLGEIGFPKEVAAVFLSFQADIQGGYLEAPTSDFEKALGKPLTKINEALTELLA